MKSKNIASLIVTLAILIVGSILYFNYALIQPSGSFFETLKLKAAITEEGNMKLFAYSQPDELSDLRPEEGNNKIIGDFVVIGESEANMMEEEGLFNQTGDRLQNFFNINTTVGGILRKTGTITDDIHFLSAQQFDEIQGDEKIIFIKMLKEMPKVFYTYSVDSKLKFNLEEGDINDYKLQFIGNKKYYPLIVGYEEAKMMKEEKLFKKTGDTISNFFDNDVFIAGVIEKTGTAIDMMHFIPLTKEELE
jgi:hypothetical protein